MTRCHRGPLAAAGMALGLAAASAAAPASHRLARSAAGRFIVVGPDVALCAAYARWAEDYAGRASRLLGVALPDAAEPLRIELVAPGAAGPPGVRLTGRTDRAGGGPVLETSADESVHPEDLLEALCALWLDALAASAARPAAPAARPYRVPGWLTVGVAMNLHPDLRDRNRALARRGARAAGPPAFAEVLRWTDVPRAAHTQRAFCGLAVAWLAREGGDTLFTRIAERLSAGSGGLTPEWLVPQLSRSPTPEAAEAAWRAWLGAQQRVARAMGVLSSEWLRQLRRELELRPAEGMAGDASAAAPRACRPAEVVGRRRREAWVPLAARCAAERVRAMAAGKAPEFARVAGQYALFFDHLALGRATWRLRLELARADRACGRLLQLTEAREAYLDAAEAIAGGDRAGPSAGAEPALEKSPLEIYVDDVERRVGNAPAGTGE